ncbi:MAG: PAS domain-containing protein [Pseudomonadota bacterium]|nr:PAS domain-containing protein [Pseudomonadota bacterium]
MADVSTDHAQDFWRVPVVLDQPFGAGDAADPARDFAAMAQYLPILCWIAHGDGAIFWYNQRWHDYCGSTPSEMAGWGWQSVHDPERLPEVIDRWTAAITAGAPFEMAFPLRGVDGKFRPFLTRVVPIRNPDGSVVRWFGVNMEIGAQVFAERALVASEAKFEVLTDAMPQMVWSTLPDGYHDYYNARWYEFTGTPEGSTDGEGWNDVFHPDDRDRAWAAWRHSIETGDPYQIEYRLRHIDGGYRWVLGRALPIRESGPDGPGAITRWFGTCTDIHEQKLAIEEREVISQELSHRIKNIFAVVAGLVSFAARAKPELAEVAADLRQRITALGRAHDFVRPHSANSRPTTQQDSLAGLLEELFDPYQEADGKRIVVTGDSIPIDDRSATPLALLFHELATNATKYGALSAHESGNEGRIDVSVTAAGKQATIVWAESGGPRVVEPAGASGFGTQLIELSAVRQLGGTIKRDWRTDGLIVTAQIPLTSLSRGRSAGSNPDERQ